MTRTKQEGRDLAEKLSKESGRKVEFMCWEEGALCLQITRYQTLRTEHLDGTIEEGFIHDDPMKPNSLPVYAEIVLYREDYEDARAAKMMIQNNWTRQIELNCTYQVDERASLGIM